MTERKTVAIIFNTDFGIIEKVGKDKYKIKTVHGDVHIISGCVEDEPDALMTFGIVDGEIDARIAIYKDLDKVQEFFGGAK
jgi:hypothetical protein